MSKKEEEEGRMLRKEEEEGRMLRKEGGRRGKKKRKEER
jgi:hypothetical protein